MLDAKKTQSFNEVTITGLLKELNVVEGESDKGAWIRCTATIQVDQEINGKTEECLIQDKMFTMRKKKDGDDNPVYNTILKYKEEFTSAAVAEDISQASRVTIPKAKLEENVWFDPNTKQERHGFQISGNFMNKARPNEPDTATFSMSGYVFRYEDEKDKEGEPTGRLLVTFGAIGYNGKMNRLILIAEGTAKAHIEQNWYEEETVKVVGRINVSQKEADIVEKSGFGESIVKPRTIPVRELIITGGSASSLEEELSYDKESIKLACSERLQMIEEKKQKETSAKGNSKAKSTDYGF